MTVDRMMLQAVLNKLDYRLDVCRVTQGEYIEHLWSVRKICDHAIEFLQEEKLSELAASKRSLNNYDSRTVRSTLPQVAGSIVACSFNIIVGIALTYSAVLIPAIESPQSDIKVTVGESSWIVSITTLFIALGGLIIGPVMDSIGRLNTLRLAIIPSATGWVLIALARNTAMLIAGRALIGLAAALGTNPVAVYITEITRPDLRAALLSVVSLFCTTGMELLYLQGSALHWRTIAWGCVAYTFVPLLLLCFIHESPPWLVGKGKIERAKKSLEWLHKYQDHFEGQSVAQIHLSILQKEHELELENKRQQKKENRTRQILRAFLKPTGYKPTLILLGLFVAQQFSGIYVILFYSVIFFQGVGADINPYLASIVIGGITVAMSVVNIFTLKKFTKRILMLSSCLGMALCLFISGFFTKRIHEGTEGLTWIPVVSLFLFMVTSMWGMLPVPWTMVAEMYPLDIRGVGASAITAAAGGIMFGAVQSYRTLDILLGGAHGVQFFFGAVSVVSFVFIFIFVPETYGKKLSEIEDYFRGK